MHIQRQAFQKEVPGLLLNDFLKIHEEIEDRSSHERLRDDLVEHLWARYRAR